MFPNKNLRLSHASPLRPGVSSPRRSDVQTCRRSDVFSPPPLRAPKSRRINTYETPRKCCIQRTYGITKFFRINTYKKHRGRGCYAHPTRMRILSDHRESKDSSPVPLFGRSLHRERFTTLLESIASKLFPKTAGCMPTIPILELNARSPRARLGQR